MRLVDRLRGRYSSRYWEGEASGAAVLLPTFSLDGKREGPNQTLVAQIHDAYASNGVVFACVLARLLLLSQATFKFRDKTDKSLSNLPPRAGILEEPWPNGTTGDLWARMEQEQSMAGNTYIWQAAPDRLVWLPAAEVVIVSQDVTAPGGATYRDVIGYAWDPAAALPGVKSDPDRVQMFTVDEIAHWAPVPDPDAKWRGMSWLTPILREVAADSGFTRYKTKFLSHGHQVVAVKYAQKLQPTTVDAVADRIQAKYGGVDNAFRPLVFDQGADPVVGKGLDGLDLRNIQGGGENRICGAAGVPPVIVGLKDADTGVSYQAAMRKFADNWARPMWQSGCAALEKLVAVPNGQQLWYDTGDIAALQAAETERAQVAQVHAAAILTLVQAGYTRVSVIAAVNANDMSLLKPDPNAPTPGVAERETITAPLLEPPTGPGSGESSNVQTVQRPDKAGSPPGGGQVLTAPQTVSSKKPMPASIPTMPNGNRQPSNPSPNGSN